MIFPTKNIRPFPFWGGFNGSLRVGFASPMRHLVPREDLHHLLHMVASLKTGPRDTIRERLTATNREVAAFGMKHDETQKKVGKPIFSWDLKDLTHTNLNFFTRKCWRWLFRGGEKRCFSPPATKRPRAKWRASQKTTPREKVSPRLLQLVAFPQCIQQQQNLLVEVVATQDRISYELIDDLTVWLPGYFLQYKQVAWLQKDQKGCEGCGVTFCIHILRLVSHQNQQPDHSRTQVNWSWAVFFNSHVWDPWPKTWLLASSRALELSPFSGLPESFDSLSLRYFPPPWTGFLRRFPCQNANVGIMLDMKGMIPKSEHQKNDPSLVEAHRLSQRAFPCPHHWFWRSKWQS